MEINPIQPDDNELKKTFNELRERRNDLLNIIDQIESKGKKADFFSSVDHYKDELETVNSLIKTFKSLLDKT